jgi:hypothetical protein
VALAEVFSLMFTDSKESFGEAEKERWSRRQTSDNGCVTTRA